MQPKRIVVVDDHAVVRDLLKFRIQKLPDHLYEVAGEGDSGQSAIDICMSARPEILLLDLMLPDMSGCEVVRRLRSTLPSLRVLFFSGSTRTELITEAINLGAAGFVSKLLPWQTILEALQLVANGGGYFDKSVAHLVATRLNPPSWNALTEREREVAQLVAKSTSTKEIAQLFGVSIKTVDKHRTRMMEKLHVHDAAAVTRYAAQAGWISSGSEQGN